MHDKKFTWIYIVSRREICLEAYSKAEGGLSEYYNNVSINISCSKGQLFLCSTYFRGAGRAC